MSELRDEIQNLSAVLELLQTEARAGLSLQKFQHSAQVLDFIA